MHTQTRHSTAEGASLWQDPCAGLPGRGQTAAQPTQPDASSSTEMLAFPSVIHLCGNQANCRGEAFINYFIAGDFN